MRLLLQWKSPAGTRPKRLSNTAPSQSPREGTALACGVKRQRKRETGKREGFGIRKYDQAQGSFVIFYDAVVAAEGGSHTLKFFVASVKQPHALEGQSLKRKLAVVPSWRVGPNAQNFHQYDVMWTATMMRSLLLTPNLYLNRNICSIIISFLLLISLGAYFNRSNILTHTMK